MHSQKTNHHEGERGFFKFIAAFIVLAGFLAYFGIDIRGFVESHPKLLEAIQDITNTFMNFWTGQVWPALLWSWDKALWLLDKILSIVMPFWEWLKQVFGSIGS